MLSHEIVGPYLICFIVDFASLKCIHSRVKMYACKGIDHKSDFCLIVENTEPTSRVKIHKDHIDFIVNKGTKVKMMGVCNHYNSL